MWSKWDLHLHTPSSFDYKDKSITNEQLVEKLIDSKVEVVAITDHHTIDIQRIARMQELGDGRLTVFPGIELRSEHGSKPIHYICIFPEDSDLDHVWTKLQGGLGLTSTDIENKGGDDRIYVHIADAHKIVTELGGVISIHAGEKTNSIEEIKNHEQFQQRIKYDILNRYVDLLEIGQLKDINSYKEKVFPKTGLLKPLIIGSDNHDIKTYSPKETTWLKADPTFKGLLMVLREPDNRVFIGDVPTDVYRWQNNPTKIIDKIVFQPKSDLPIAQKWFSGDIVFNSGLIAIIGNKGSGKSALSDTMGLLGSTKNSESFSFLSGERFCDPKKGYAQYFDAKLVFKSGDELRKGLNEIIKPEEAERVKYLPQDHIEDICNDLAAGGDSSFEKELKTVIFSHVPNEKKYGQPTLDKLIDFSASEKRKRIEVLKKSLIDINQKRSELEIQSDPSYAKSIGEQIKKKESEIAAHELLKPALVDDPKTNGIVAKEIDQILSKIQELEKSKVETESLISDRQLKLEEHERKHAVARRLLESINNFQEEFTSFKSSIETAAIELGILIEDVVKINFKTEKINDIITAEKKYNIELRAELNSIDPPGLSKKLELLIDDLAKLKTQLDTPNIEYQKSISAMQEWEKKKKLLIGNINIIESLEGLKYLLMEHSKTPDRIQEMKQKQIAIMQEIYTEKRQLSLLYQELYEPVQEYINSHKVASEKLMLEFKAELMDDGFVNKILPMIAKNKRGSFYGVDEGKILMDGFVHETDMEDWNSVKNFVQSVDDAFHFYTRDAKRYETLLADQLVKDIEPVDVFNLLYGLDYIVPRYILKWDRKDLTMLSPGERGTLLLIFYLLIDKSDYPLVIDQPEGNLDNQTVTMVLVDCIREARQRRQVCIVTHNPNIAVVCDADQVIRATMDIEDGNKISYQSGALENAEMNLAVTDVLEGTRSAFDVRNNKYKIMPKEF